MRSTKFLAALCIAAMFASCAKEEFVQENPIQDEALVGAELVGSNISMNFTTGSDTKLNAEGWELNDKLGLAWIVSGNPGDVQSSSADPSSAVQANHMFQKEGDSFTTKGNVYKGWHYAYYPFGYMEAPGTAQKVAINPVQTDKMIVDYYKTGLYVSARDFLTKEKHLNDNNQLENVNFKMWRVSNAINVQVEPSAAFTDHIDLKGLAFQKMVLTTDQQVFLAKYGDVTLNAAELPEVVYDYDKVAKVYTYNDEETIEALIESLPAVLTGTKSSKSITTEVDNSEINLSGSQELRINTLAGKAVTIDPAKVSFVFFVQGGKFEVKYTSDKALADLDASAKAVATANNAEINKLVKAYAAKGEMTKYGDNLKLNLKLTADMFTADFSSISDINEWNQAVKVANALCIEDPTFVVDGEVKINSTFTLPENGLAVETKGNGCITVAENYTMEEALAVALDKADVVKVAKKVTLTIPDNMFVNAAIENLGTIKVGVKAEVNEVNNAKGRIDVVYGSYVTVAANKDGVVAYEVLPFGQETPARVNTLIHGGNNGKYARVNTLVINKDITFDMNMTNTSESANDPYYNTVVDRSELVDLKNISIEMKGGSIIGDASLTESVKKVDVLAGENTMFDLNVENNLTVAAGASVNVDATIHNFGTSTYKKDVNVKGDITNAGNLTAKTTIYTANIDNASGNTLVEKNYTIWYATKYVQGGKAEGKILKNSPVTEVSETVETLDALKAALKKSGVTTVVISNNILSGEIDLKGKTLKAAAGKQISISQNATIKNGTIASKVHIHNPEKANTVIFEKVTFSVAGLGSQAYTLQWQTAKAVTLKDCIFNTTGRPFEGANRAATEVIVDGCLVMNTVGTNNPYVNPLGDNGKVTIKNSTFEVAVSCEVEDNENKFDITGNIFEKHFGTAVADGIKSATRTFLNEVLDNNTFTGNDKISVYDVTLKEEKFYDSL